jgi:hypothetical protein
MTEPTCEDTFVTQKRTLSNGYYSLSFGSYSCAAECWPGQFVHIKLPQTDIFFRRAFSVAGVSPNGRAIEILVKVSNRGSVLLAALRQEDRVNPFGPLGIPFKLSKKNETTLMVAGGIGVPPLLSLAYTIVKGGYDPKWINFFCGGATSVELANPILTASGCCSYGEEVTQFFPLLKLGALVTKSITLKPRLGHPPSTHRRVRQRHTQRNRLGQGRHRLLSGRQNTFFVKTEDKSDI